MYYEMIKTLNRYDNDNQIHDKVFLSYIRFYFGLLLSETLL